MALDARRSSADRAALLRQAALLLDNHIDLPQKGWNHGLEDLNQNVLDRFGVSLHSTAGRWVAALIHEGGPNDAWPEGLTQELGLDPNPRVSQTMSSPDGSLLRLTPHTSYRIPTQKAAARALLTMPPGASLMISMPTGAGKSLLFQLGVRWWRETEPDHPQCVVVIVPTVGLALDHVESFKLFPGLEECRALTSDCTRAERELILMNFIRGEVPILVMNPESAFHSARETLERVSQPRSQRLGDARAELAAVFIDEAHIIETWGRSFRPDFQRLTSLIARLRTTNPNLRTILLSATMTEESRALLKRDYASGAVSLEIRASVPRYELDLFAKQYARAERDQVLFNLLDRVPRPAIVYTTTPAAATGVLERLQDRGFEAVSAFTGDTESDNRKAILKAWRNDELDIVVATSAFGMGIDKPNVRTVIHACFPEDASRYYQEVGRAGRDGHQAIGICLWTDDDMDTAKSMRTKDWLSVDLSVERWNQIVRASKERGRYNFDPNTGRMVLKIDINIAPLRLGSFTGEHNREWNRTLLNLMQRANAVEILDADPRTQTWTVAVGRPEILGGNDAVSRQVFSIREDESRGAREAFMNFREVMAGDLCLLAETFLLIENKLAAQCGHCGPCRRDGGAAPEAVQYHGLRQEWTRPFVASGPPTLPGSILFEHEEYDFGTLLTAQVARLATLGYLQFVIPDGWTRHCADLLRVVPRHPGLVLGFEEAFKVVPYSVPTVALVDQSFPDVYQQAVLRRFLGRPRPERPALAVVARHGHQLDGRPLGQMMDVTYPIALLSDGAPIPRKPSGAIP